MRFSGRKSAFLNEWRECVLTEKSLLGVLVYLSHTISIETILCMRVLHVVYTTYIVLYDVTAESVSAIKSRVYITEYRQNSVLLQ